MSRDPTIPTDAQGLFCAMRSFAMNTPAIPLSSDEAAMGSAWTLAEVLRDASQRLTREETCVLIGIGGFILRGVEGEVSLELARAATRIAGSVQ